MILRTGSGGIKTRGSTGTEVWGRVQMKNIRSNCMTKPPRAWFGGGRMGVRQCGEQGEGDGSVNSEVKRVVVGGAET